jgi:multiple RNA-binding domain-containing protein 1
LAKQKARELHDPRYKAEQLMKVDPKFREFMELMVPAKQKFWSDGFFEDQDKLEGYRKDSEKALREDGDAGSSDDEYQDLDESEDEEQEEESDKSGSESDSESESESDKVANDDKVSDMDYFKSKQSTWKDDEDDSEDSDSDDSESSSDDEQSQSSDASEDEEKSSDSDDSDEPDTLEEEEKNAAEPESKDVNAADMEALSETGRIFVRNLPYTATEEEVAALFEQRT